MIIDLDKHPKVVFSKHIIKLTAWDLNLSFYSLILKVQWLEVLYTLLRNIKYLDQCSCGLLNLDRNIKHYKEDIFPFFF